VHFTERLRLHGISPSIRTVGDSYDNALAETTIGLYKTECIRDDSPSRRGPLTGLSDVEAITADWIHWYNASRLMHRLDRCQPVEAEADYSARTRDDQPDAHT
jgi:putative transposase